MVPWLYIGAAVLGFIVAGPIGNFLGGLTGASTTTSTPTSSTVVPSGSSTDPASNLGVAIGTLVNLANVLLGLLEKLIEAAPLILMLFIILVALQLLSGILKPTVKTISGG